MGGYGSIWVVVDHLIKLAHFLSVKTRYCVEDYAILFLSEIIHLYGVPVVIIFDRGPQFTSLFGRTFRQLWGLSFSLVLLFILRLMPDREDHLDTRGYVEGLYFEFFRELDNSFVLD